MFKANNVCVYERVCKIIFKQLCEAVTFTILLRQREKQKIKVKPWNRVSGAHEIITWVSLTGDPTYSGKSKDSSPDVRQGETGAEKC